MEFVFISLPNSTGGRQCRWRPTLQENDAVRVEVPGEHS